MDDRWDWLDRLAADGGEMYHEAQEHARREAEYKAQMRREGMLNLRQLLHILQGGAPSRNPHIDPAAGGMLPAHPARVINGAVPPARPLRPPHTPSVGVRG